MTKYGSLFFCSVLLMLLLFPASAMASYHGPQIHSGHFAELAKTNGQYDVYVLRDGKWQAAGVLKCDQYFREQQVDLSGYLPKSGKIRVLLVQKDGNAAHIDSVFLGGMPPSEVKGTHEKSLLSKLSRKDFDVIDAFGKSFELVFPATGKDRELSLTARVEGKRISEMPFQFPSENFYRKMGLKSKFYTFRPHDEKDHTAAEVRKISLTPPLFKEFSPTGSGHPSGFTYGWVTNDEKNLYVRIDFTPDNTMDGDKDYAKVYVRTDDGLKEFKVSQYNTRWGRPDFTYTDKVAYQHKVYSFQIPLREIAMSGADEKIEVAFAAYGTAAPGNAATGMAYDPGNNRHLAVFMTGGGSSAVFGQFMDCSGNATGPAFPITSNANINFYPSVAYDTTNQVYMVVWEENISGNWHITGQRIDADGMLLGGNFNISGLSNNQYGPKIAYNSTDHNFLVTWADTGAGIAFDVFGRLMDSTGAFLTGSLNLSNAASDQYHQDVVYNSVNDEFLVVWQLGGVANDIYGQRVNAQTGALIGTSPFLIYSGGSTNQDSPSAAYDPVRNQYLVVWDDAASGYDINGRFIDASNGNPIGGVLPISNDPAEQVNPLVIYNSASGQFLVVWTDRRGGGADVYGQYVNAATRTLSGDNFLVLGGSGDQEPASVSYNSLAGNILVASVNTAGFNTAFTLLGPPCGAVQIPTMGQWGMIIFMILAGLGSLYFLGRRRRNN